MDEPKTHYILPAEHVGFAKTEDGILNIGGLEINVGQWARRGEIGVYVRRDSEDLSIMEIHLARHDGLAQEELDRQNEEAERYPLGPKAYWHGERVGKEGWTEEEFEEFWADGEDEDD